MCVNDCNCKYNHTSEDNTKLNTDTYNSDCVTKYRCRICGKEFENISDCIQHEYDCYQKKEEGIRKEQQKKEFEKRQTKLATKKIELKDAKNETLEAWNNYIEKKNKEHAIRKEINELEFGKENFDIIRTYLDIFNL